MFHRYVNAHVSWNPEWREYLMKGLLKKDGYFLLDLKPQILITIICVVATLLLAKINPDFSIGFINAYILLLFSMVPVSTIAYDEENNGLSYLLSMAISRKTYVNSKYMLALLFSVAIGVFVAILSAAVKLISGQAPYPFGENGEISTLEFLKILVLIEIFSSSISIILNSISLPSFFKYGAKKGAIITAIGLFIIAAIIGFVSFVMIDVQGPEQFMENMAQGSIVSTAILALIISAIAMIISYGLSQKIMGAKEF